MQFSVFICMHVFQVSAYQPHDSFASQGTLNNVRDILIVTEMGMLLASSCQRPRATAKHLNMNRTALSQQIIIQNVNNVKVEKSCKSCNQLWLRLTAYSILLDIVISSEVAESDRAESSLPSLWKGQLYFLSKH